MLRFHPVFSLTALRQARRGSGRGVDPALSPAYGRFISKGHHLQSPAFRQEVFLHKPQEWDFYECGLTENDLGGLFRAPWS